MFGPSDAFDKHEGGTRTVEKIEMRRGRWGKGKQAKGRRAKIYGVLYIYGS